MLDLARQFETIRGRYAPRPPRVEFFTPTAVAVCGYSLSGCARATPFTELWALNKRQPVVKRQGSETARP